MNRRALLSAAGLAALAGPLAACSSDSGDSGSSPSYSIGIMQVLTHGSLDAAREGFEAAFADAGIACRFDEKNAQGDQGTATSIASEFSSQGLDLVLAIGTPAAQAAAQAITQVPVLFTAVTDPVSAQLVASSEAPGGNVTGTSDMNPVAEQIGLIKQIKPEASSVGLLHSAGEVNSQVQIDLARTAAEDQDLSVRERTITNAAELQQAAEALDVDAIYVPTDNNVVSGLATIVALCENRRIPLVVAEGDSVRNGGVITYGIDYTRLGRQTGEMAIRILRDGADPATVPVQTQSDLTVYVNETAAAAMGVTIPADLLDGAERVG
ncbi:ABC transporter substrate-binding protein [uncultured Propionibacterium sp.]|uniref:ABC transporter substrate-binding protein n=1 Tax=uncultured Propionibacterium sp. TaxID=218066 RepID=UPI00292E786C|nr:ABC transporter substrate-binding protein [uncultured Propionibacterium sp.]